MFVLRNYVQDPTSGTITESRDKDAYVSFVYARTATDSIARGVDPVNYDAPARKLFIHAFSLPFWAAMPNICDDETFYDLLCFVNAQDIVVAPESMFHAFQVYEKSSKIL